MATTEKKVVTRTCDICGREVERFARATESFSKAVVKIRTSTWYGKDKLLDVCQTCSNNLVIAIDNMKRSEPHE